MIKALVLLACLVTYRHVYGEATFQQYADMMFQFDSVFETLCLEKTNDPNEARRMVTANQELQNCVNRHHDPQNFTSALDALTVENRVQFISYNCEQFEKIKRCYHPFTQQLEVCFSERDIAMAKSLIMLEEEFDYICENDGTNIIPTGSSNYSYCAGNLKELLCDCSVSDWIELKHETIATMTARHCRMFQKLVTCFQDNITKCGAPLFAHLFNIRYQAFLKQTSCDVTGSH